jgi:squalene-hopene/tetraprenyl-beta-curcumene cyclase
MTPLDPLQLDVSQRSADAVRLVGSAVPRLHTLSSAIELAENAVLAAQDAAGFWCYELEADCTIPAEYVLMMHYLDEIDTGLELRLARYLRAHQVAENGWPLYAGGRFDLSCSVKAYYALKLAGDDPDAPHMAAARSAILAHGGAARANVFTRIALALFGQLPWRGVPFMPVELVVLPRWFPFHLDKISYWSRTVVVPLLILCSLRKRARNPRGVSVLELFTAPPEHEKHYFPNRSRVNACLVALSHVGHALEPLIPGALRRRAIQAAEAWFVERLNGTGGLGAIFPAMVNACEALDALGYARDDPRCVTAREALKRLLVSRGDSAYCQPCVSPVWDTTLACLALQEAEEGANAVPSGASAHASKAVDRALTWLKARQLLDHPGDWRTARPDLPGGGWPFQFDNDYYPDLDDTAVVLWALDRRGDVHDQFAMNRGVTWLCGMQSRNGGFAAFDADNTYYYLNEIPFADHGALIDPPTADVSARCALALARLGAGDPRCGSALTACLSYLRKEQEPSGAWFGRWGTNYIYGTWSVLAAFEAAGVDPRDHAVRRAAGWLKRVQRADGGWGEDNWSYYDSRSAGRSETSTSFHTAWALLGLIAAGEVRSPEVAHGVQYLIRTQRHGGAWYDEAFTAPGFPRVFFLKYHGYSQYFPLWALARYRNVLEERARS